ncbi:MAG: large repetitive protein, partial [Thermoleophilaceae bacterium]|nr:large repetitive protein [Thermoleophilaceae bacterium]
DSADPVTQGEPFQYTLTVANAGPDKALGVTLADHLPPGLTYETSNATQGSCAQGGGTVTCAIGALTKNQAERVTIRVTPTGSGPVTDTATVAADTADPATADNTATESTTIVPPSFHACRDSTPPRSSFGPHGLSHSRHRVIVRGNATDQGCAGSAAAHTFARPGEVARVKLSLARRLGHGMCRFLLQPAGFSRAAPCAHRRWLRVHGARHWSFGRGGRFPVGHYVAVVEAVDAAGNEQPLGSAGSVVTFGIR